MGSLKYLVIICLLFAGSAQAATVVSSGTFSNYTSGVKSRLTPSGNNNGQIPIWDNTTRQYIPGDPLVQGLYGDASTSKANPVLTGIWDGTNLRAAKGDTNGYQAVNVQNFPGTQPVSGTFYQATQPVSLATAPTTPVTGTFWQGTQPVSLASVPSHAVTGTFWQATQPVSGTVGVSGTVPVSGSFYQATQPVSIASMPSTPVTGTFWQATQPTSAVQLPSALGAKTTANSMAVNVASDQVLNVRMGDSVDATNSSTATLTANSTYTGSWVSTLGYNMVAVDVASDQVSATNGLIIQFSTDAANIYDTYTASFNDVVSGNTFAVPTKAQYYRIVYTNGTTGQTVFRLQTVLRVNWGGGDVTDLADPIGPTDHAQVTRALMAGRTAPGSLSFNDVAVRPSGHVEVMDDPHQLFYDPFDAALDTTNRWNAAVAGGGGVGASVSGGNLTLGTGTTLNGYSYLTSQPTFPSPTPGWLRFANNIALPYTVVASTYMAFGAGTINGTPASTGCPACTNTFANAAVFEVNTDGKMYAAVYQSNTRTPVQDLSTATGNGTQPANSNTHNYEVWYRPTKIYWYIDSAVVATSSYGQSALNVDTIPSTYLVVQGATTPATLSSNAVSVSDSAKNNSQISDGQFPWRKATIKAASTAAATADASITVQLNPIQPNLTTPLNVSAAQATAANLNATVVQGNAGSNAQAWWTRIGDATNGPAAVKAASTTPAATDPALVTAQSPNGGNPCVNPSATLTSIRGATSGTTSVQLVALSGSTKIYVCSMTVIGVSGTTPTFSLVYGTGSNCATGQAVFSQSWGTTAGQLYAYANPVGVTPSGQALCYLDTGTTPIQNYAITYVQQ